MKYNPNPKHGEPVRVRLPSGEIKQGVYDGWLDGKSHFVAVDDDIFVASKAAPYYMSGQIGCDRVRFVYPVEQMK